ncbi:trypsin-like peptidase domain-containing protein [bacterium]|nr:trypsin-like peptidase domain-containing protein [bacterium]
MLRIYRFILSALISTAIITISLPAFSQVDPAAIRSDFPSISVFEKVKDSMVSITSVELPYSGYGRYSAYTKTILTSGGTGFIVTEDGYVLTYLGTVEESEIVKVTIGEDEYEADVVATDDFFDIALLKIDDPDAEGIEFSPIQWGDSEDILRGDPVVVVGDPAGGIDKTLTYGFVTNFRDLRLAGPHNFDGVLISDAIEIDASITRGNYGGPVFNRKGEVIAVVNRLASGSEDMNYTIPSNLMKNMFDQLYERGEIFHPWFGVFPYNKLDKRLAVYLGIPMREVNPDTDEPYGIVGVLIDDVAATSPAARSGIRKGDLILELNGILLKTQKQLEKLILAMEEDETFAITIVRNGEVFYKRIRVSERATDYANLGWVASI